MNSPLSGLQWIWHPDWIDNAPNSAGAFVNFRKSFTLHQIPTDPVSIQITADTKYKFYVNNALVAVGPVKGDNRTWFYDEIDIQPYLKVGINNVAVRVLRFYYATPYATSFPRMPDAGFLVKSKEPTFHQHLESNKTWEAAIDLSTSIPINLAEDDFLHVYEVVKPWSNQSLRWKPAKELSFPTTHGLSAPWKLRPRMIPGARWEKKCLVAIHKIESTLSEGKWVEALLGSAEGSSIRIPAGTSHHIEIEAESHMTAFLRFRFEKPSHSGSSIQITYSECYEDTPTQVPYVRNKGDRCDKTKKLLGPQDIYAFTGQVSDKNLNLNGCAPEAEEEEVFAPFHWRTFRFLTLDIKVSNHSDLVFKHIDLTATTYPLNVIADLDLGVKGDPLQYEKLWSTSIRTLQNCMHDCYEDCPFYEQLQYAMDTRSSALFTYSVSSDDRLARQAIVQLHNSYDPSHGLTGSRAPSHQPQFIPNFSLFWICMITDHFEYFSDAAFASRFLPECDGVLESFARRVDPQIGLVRCVEKTSLWDFLDWATEWRPMGIPPAAEETGFQSCTNMIYAYTLKRAASLLIAVGRPGLAAEYQSRADSIVEALKEHCYDGEFFTDGLALKTCRSPGFSQHSQVWAVMCGAATDKTARRILATSLAAPIDASALESISSKTHPSPNTTPSFTPTSIAMSFYTLRALSLAGSDLYNTHFHAFWGAWRAQLAQNLSTWCEDSVSQRSDCHAWGAAPLYEFTSEVAGIRPGSPGWGVLDFRPRVGLFERLDVRVPFGGRAGEEKAGAGIAWVSWEPVGCKEEGVPGKVRVRLSLTLHSGERASLSVRAILPGVEAQMRSGADKLEFVI